MRWSRVQQPNHYVPANPTAATVPVMPCHGNSGMDFCGRFFAEEQGLAQSRQPVAASRLSMVQFQRLGPLLLSDKWPCDQPGPRRNPISSRGRIQGRNIWCSFFPTFRLVPVPGCFHSVPSRFMRPLSSAHCSVSSLSRKSEEIGQRVLRRRPSSIPFPPHDGRHKDRATKVEAPASPSRCCPAFVVLRRPSAQLCSRLAGLLMWSPPRLRAIDVTDLFIPTCLVRARFDSPPVAPLLYLELLLLSFLVQHHQS